jgi:hypothetical protein
MGSIEWDIDACVREVTLIHVVDCLGPLEAALKERTPSWAPSHVVASYYDKTGQDNVVSESLRVDGLPDEDRKTWLDTHMIGGCTKGRNGPAGQ